MSAWHSFIVKSTQQTRMHDYDTAVENKHLHMNNTHPFNGALSRSKTVSGRGISSAMCKSATRSRQTAMPTPHHCFFTGRMPFLLPNQQHESTEGAKH